MHDLPLDRAVTRAPAALGTAGRSRAPVGWSSRSYKVRKDNKLAPPCPSIALHRGLTTHQVFPNCDRIPAEVMHWSVVLQDEKLLSCNSSHSPVQSACPKAVHLSRAMSLQQLHSPIAAGSVHLTAYWSCFRLRLYGGRSCFARSGLRYSGSYTLAVLRAYCYCCLPDDDYVRRASSSLLRPPTSSGISCFFRLLQHALEGEVLSIYS